MNAITKRLNVAIVAFALLAVSSGGLAYQVYADSQVEKEQTTQSHPMTYEEAVKATEKDCCK